MPKTTRAQALVASVRDPDALQALSHPIRVQALDALREPGTAASVARQIGQPRQLVNYHLKALEEAALVERVGRRRNGNFIETTYRAIARSFVVSPDVVRSDPRRVEALRSQHSLETLVVLGERLQQDAAALLDRAAFDGEDIPSAAVTADVRFACEEDRAAFLREYLETTSELLERYGARKGARYRVAMATYPGEKT